MADNLISVVTLPSDAGSGFSGGLSGYEGDKIYVYWDDVSEYIKVNLENNTGSSGTNLATWGDSGDFETVETGWLGSERSKPAITPPGNLTRSSTVAHAGTYSAKLICPSTTYVNLIYQSFPVTVGKQYIVSCWVYVPSGSPIASSGNIIFYNNPNSTVNVSATPGTTIAACTDTWVQITANVTPIYDFNPFIGIKLSGGTPITNGVIYFDEFYIVEDTGYSSVTTEVTTGPILPDLTQSDINTNSGSFPYTGKWTSGFATCNANNTLSRFNGYLIGSYFPYALKVDYPNHFSCVGGVLSKIEFVLLSITTATSAFDEDGAFEVLGVSNTGDVIYAISEEQPLYESVDGQTTGVFSSLIAGTYTVWCVDENQNAKSLTITIPFDISNTPQPTVTNTYAEKYRMDYTDVQNVATRRVMIWERNFNGSYVEVKGGAVPFMRELTESELNDKFDPIRETNATANFISERDLQFIGLFSQDDRKFQIRYEYPVGTELWRGYVVPSVFSEPYSDIPPYETTITATDGLILLNDEDFLDRNGNEYDGYESLIVTVAEILKKLDLELPIRVAANISEDSHNGIMPFEETQYNLSHFYEDDRTPWNCTRVLRAILMPFGAKLVQDEGYWNIIRVEEQTETYDVKIYDVDGVFSSNSTYNPILAISDPTLRINSMFAGDHLLEVNPAYGTITINHNLFPKVSLLTGYSFEENDLEGNSFRGWSVSSSGGIILYSREEIIPGKSAIQFRGLDNISSLFSTGNKYALLKSIPFLVEFSEADSFKFSFQYRLNSIKIDRFGNTIDPSTLRSFFGPPYWTRVGWRISIGTNIFYNETVGWTDNSEFQWNYVWVSREDYNKVLDFKIDKFYAPTFFSNTRTSSFEVSLQIEGGATTDSQSQAELEAIPTDTKPIGYKTKLYNSGSYYYYELVDASGLTPSFPYVVEPDDWHTTNNNVYWSVETSIGGGQFEINSIFIDDVVFNIYPNSEEIPKVEVLEITNNKDYKEKLVIDLEGGDVTQDDIRSKQYIYNLFQVDQNEELTDSWTRDAVSTESVSIQNILLKSLINQYRYPSFRFSGNMIGITDFGFLTTLKHTQTAPSLSLTNEEFTSNSTGWDNSDTGTSWAYDSGDVQVALSGAVDSKLFGQDLTGYAGQRVSVEYSIARTATSGNRGDWFICALTQSGSIVQEIVLEDNMVSDASYTNLRRFSFDNDFDAIHFYVRNISGTGDATYDVDFFRLVPLDIVRYYTPNRLSINDKDNEYSGEWTQLIPIVFSSDPTIDDSGEGNTGSDAGGGSGTGGSGGDYNNDYNADYNI